MTLHPWFLPLIIGMAAVTYLPRWFPLFFLSGRHLPRAVIIWLGFITPAVLAALVLATLVTAGEPRHLSLMNKDLLVAIPVSLFALRTKSMGATVLFGMALFWAAGKLFG
jgi:branched-subunit amino acid transport protein